MHLTQRFLLFILFLSIKRLYEAEAASKTRAPKTQKLQDIILATGQDEIITCDPHKAIQINDATVKPNTDTYAKAKNLQQSIISNAITVQLLKNNAPLHRENGNFIMGPSQWLNSSKFETTLFKVNHLDEGKYTCKFNVTIPQAQIKQAEQWLIITPRINFGIKIDGIAQPTTSLPPPAHQNTAFWILTTIVLVWTILIIVVLKCVKMFYSKKEKIVALTERNTKYPIPIYDYPPVCNTLKSSCVVNPIYGMTHHALIDLSDWTKFPMKRFDEKDLIFIDKIGEGQFGQVHRCRCKFNTGVECDVAVKMLRSQFGEDILGFLGSERDRKDLKAEIEIMKLLTEHPNVVKMLDFWAKDNEPILLIMELVENGKLQTYLRDSRTYLKSTSNFDLYITSRDLIKFSYQIAKGMEFVASKGIIHRDLASRNILITEDRVCKVADFGFARKITDECAYERTTGEKVPVRWMAPEALVENKFTSKSDVFSFGILLWEIVTLGSTPYENLTSVQVLQKVKVGDRLEKPHHCKAELFDVMSKCWTHLPKDRPSFAELAVQLEKLLLSENDYIELNHYPNHAYYNILTDRSDEKV